MTLIPQSIAYAALAQLPSHYGLYAAFMGKYYYGTAVVLTISSYYHWTFKSLDCWCCCCCCCCCQQSWYAWDVYTFVDWLAYYFHLIVMFIFIWLAIFFSEGSLIYVFFGTIKEVSIGPTSLMALLTLQYTVDKPPEFAIILAFLAGCVELAMGILKLGMLNKYFFYCFRFLRPHFFVSIP